jgi:hypothetical protein
MCGFCNVWAGVCVGLKCMVICMCGTVTVRVDVMCGNCNCESILVICNINLLDWGFLFCHGQKCCVHKSDFIPRIFNCIVAYNSLGISCIGFV